MQIRFSRQFAKQRDKAPSDIQKAMNQKLELFATNPYNPQLNNHQLQGSLRLHRSINITGDWRAWYKIENDIVWFVAFGTHSQLYNR